MNQKIELVDLVDSSGIIRKRGIPRSKIDSYPDLYMQIVIGVVFNKKGQILVHKRAQTKKINPGDIDHICGGIMAGETPEVAALRESLEETGIRPINLRIIAQGINKYKRYRYLLVGEAETEPGEVNPSEVEWVRFIHPGELKQKSNSGEFKFVDEFFEDTNLALTSKDVS